MCLFIYFFQTRLMNQRRLKPSPAHINGTTVCTSRVYTSALDCMLQVCIVLLSQSCDGSWCHLHRLMKLLVIPWWFFLSPCCLLLLIFFITILCLCSCLCRSLLTCISVNVLLIYSILYIPYTCSSLHYYIVLVFLFQTVKLEGPLALYKGFIPTWLRLGPWNIIFFVTFEQLKKLYWGLGMCASNVMAFTISASLDNLLRCF